MDALIPVHTWLETLYTQIQFWCFKTTRLKLDEGRTLSARIAEKSKDLESFNGLMPIIMVPGLQL